MNRFTEVIHDKGATIKEFCQYWQISRRTYERMMANDDKHEKLNKMIKGFKHES
jgi:nucleoid-associated protein YgaU